MSSPNSIYTKKYLQDLARRYNSHADAARACGCHSNTIWRRAQEHGVVFRSSKKSHASSSYT